MTGGLAGGGGGGYGGHEGCEGHEYCGGHEGDGIGGGRHRKLVDSVGGKMKMEWKNYKRKGDSHQRSHHEKYAYDERKDPNNDNPYVQYYTPETRTQWTEQST